jgi:effector-binding domain-containing protein
MKIGEPTVVERPAQPYVAVRREVVIPFGPTIDEAMGTLFRELESQRIQPSGMALFKYNVVIMPELQIEFGIEVAEALTPREPLLGGTLPAGRYAQLTYLGHYDRLVEANGALIDWARAEGLEFDMRTEADGDHFASRVEFYPNGPDDEPDPEKWETVVAIKLKD